MSLKIIIYVQVNKHDYWTSVGIKAEPPKYIYIYIYDQFSVQVEALNGNVNMLNLGTYYVIRITNRR